MLVAPQRLSSVDKSQIQSSLGVCNKRMCITASIKQTAVVEGHKQLGHCRAWSICCPKNFAIQEGMECKGGSAVPQPAAVPCLQLSGHLKFKAFSPRLFSPPSPAAHTDPGAAALSGTHGLTGGQTPPAHPQHFGLSPHHQHRGQAALPHGSHGLLLHHVLRGGKSACVFPPSRCQEQGGVHGGERGCHQVTTRIPNFSYLPPCAVLSSAFLNVPILGDTRGQAGWGHEHQTEM